MTTGTTSPTNSSKAGVHSLRHGQVICNWLDPKPIHLAARSCPFPISSRPKFFTSLGFIARTPSYYPSKLACFSAPRLALVARHHPPAASAQETKCGGLTTLLSWPAEDKKEMGSPHQKRVGPCWWSLERSQSQWPHDEDCTVNSRSKIHADGTIWPTIVVSAGVQSSYATCMHSPFGFKNFHQASIKVWCLSGQCKT